jgi:hypothetical protein
MQRANPLISLSISESGWNLPGVERLRKFFHS